MTLYVAYHQDRPANVAFSGQTLADVAEAVAVQPNPDEYDVRLHRDGFAQPLRADDQAELDAIVSAGADGRR